LRQQEFVRKWRSVTLTERSAAQQHFLDLCQLVGHPTPTELDPTGTSFTFEAGVTTRRDGRGWADVWKRGYFGWEYKRRNADLDAAYQQLLKYREALENPPLLTVCDMDRIVIHTNFTNTVKQVQVITLEDLLTPDGFEHLHAVFYEPEAFRVPQTTENVTQAAAKEFASLAELLRRRGEDSHRAAHFLIRLLFCLFAEDINLLPTGLFSRLLTNTRHNPTAFAAQLRQLFCTMATGGFFGVDAIAHFNGRLFEDDTVLELDVEGLDILARVSDLRWDSIEPSVFGTLFERSLDPAKRSQLGAHYTSKEDILLIIEPVLMAPLRRRWTEIRAQSRALADRRDAASGGLRTRLRKELEALLVSFANEIRAVRVLDPACGSGNFLYVALKQLLDLEKEVSTTAGDLDVGMFFPEVSPEQLYGIEIDDYAHELSRVTVWIGYIQWLRDNGFGRPHEPFLKPLDTIVQMDAILAFDGRGQPVEPLWPEADIVIGNPPFLGGSKLRRELGDNYAEALWSLYSQRVPSGADLVTYWFERTRNLIATGQVQRAGLIATQAIRAGASRTVLDRIKQSGNVFMGWSDRPWMLDGAAVRVSIIGFDGGVETSPILDGKSVTVINANLTGALDLTTAKRLLENGSIAYQGPSKKGPFELDSATAQRMIQARGNPNGHPNSDVVRPWLNGSDITGHPRGMWIIDFGANMPLEEAALYELPFEYVKRHVFPVRLQNRRTAYAEKWWLHAEPRSGMRRALAGKYRYIATPRVAKHRLFVWVAANHLADDRTFVFARDDDYFFGVLHSRLHELWSLATSSRHGDGSEGGRPTYNSSTCFETFPLPWPTDHEPAGDPRVEAIAAAARELVAKRDAWLNSVGASEAELKKRTLTNLYNQRPTWLDVAHIKLDYAVLDAYGWPRDLADDEILARLLALNYERAAAQEETRRPSASPIRKQAA